MRSISWLGACALLVSFHAGAANCPSSENLVANCGFDAGTAGYTPQDGDAIAHDPAPGSSAPGAMIVVDTAADANNEAEAEMCIDLDAETNYRIGADIRAVDADQCFLGWDEYTQPGCVQTNGLFLPAAPMPVTTTRFTTLDAVLRTSPGVQSVEMVIVCQTGSNNATAFVVDDVYVQRGPLFSDGFESD